MKITFKIQLLALSMLLLSRLSFAMETTPEAAFNQCSLEVITLISTNFDTQELKNSRLICHIFYDASYYLLRTIKIPYWATDSDLIMFTEKFTKIEKIYFDNNLNITDQGLQNCKNITHLDLSDVSFCFYRKDPQNGSFINRYTDEGRKRLGGMLTMDNIFSGRKIKITNKGLNTLEKLTCLVLQTQNSITDEGLTNLKNLSYLDMGHNWCITNDGLIRPDGTMIHPLLKLLKLPAGYQKITKRTLSILKKNHVIVEEEKPLKPLLSLDIFIL